MELGNNRTVAVLALPTMLPIEACYMLTTTSQPPNARTKDKAATTRKFYKGRTEAIRVVTSESDAWVKSMNDGEVSNAKRRELFAAAVQKHVKLAKEAGNGLGVDRHILGAPALRIE